MSGTHNYDVLVFGAELHTDQIDEVERIVAGQRLDVAEVRLVDGVGRLRARGGAKLELRDRAEIMDAAEHAMVDVFVLPAERKKPRLFAFDMDSTLIQAEIIDELAGLAGVKERVAAITERAMRGEIDFRAALAERLGLLKGIEVARLDSLLKSVRLSEGLEELMKGLKASGVKTAILSGGFGFFARRLKERLGFDYVVCNELEIANDALTGRLAGEVVDATVKAASLKRIAAEEGIELSETVVVGDGANDLPMMQLAAIGVAYRAKPKVKAAAEYRLSYANLDVLLNLLYTRG